MMDNTVRSWKEAVAFFKAHRKINKSLRLLYHSVSGAFNKLAQLF